MIPSLPCLQDSFCPHIIRIVGRSCVFSLKFSGSYAWDKNKKVSASTIVLYSFTNIKLNLSKPAFQVISLSGEINFNETNVNLYITFYESSHQVILNQHRFEFQNIYTNVCRIANINRTVALAVITPYFCFHVGLNLKSFYKHGSKASVGTANPSRFLQVETF